MHSRQAIAAGIHSSCSSARLERIHLLTDHVTGTSGRSAGVSPRGAVLLRFCPGMSGVRALRASARVPYAARWSGASGCQDLFSSSWVPQRSNACAKATSSPAVTTSETISKEAPRPDGRSQTLSFAAEMRVPPTASQSVTRNLFNVHGSVGGPHDKLEGGFVCQLRGPSVQVEEDDRGKPRQALVSINQCVVAGEGVQQRRRLELKRRIRIFPESTGA